MALFAERLPVALVPKQHLVSPVRPDVIDHGCRGAAPGAVGVRDQERRPLFLPVSRVAAFAGARPARIMASVAGALRLDLADAELAVGHEAAAGANMGRSRHHIFLFSACNPARSKSGSRPAATFAARCASLGPVVIAAVVALLFCVIIGVAFGSYPAAKASKMTPIDALQRN